MARVLVVDDERSLRDVLQILLEERGHDVTVAATVETGLKTLRSEMFDLAFVDLKLPDGEGLELLRALKSQQPDAQIIMMTAYATTENAVAAMRLGAYDYQIKPFKLEEIKILSEKALEKTGLLRDIALRGRLEKQYGLSRLVGRSPKMVALAGLIEKVAPTRANVLIEGESGTGKELIARAIHENSDRRTYSFVAVNCGAIAENLIESELFGHSAGAFTGAVKARGGLFEAAHGGTLLLDEISELPLGLQVKLLRALQERKIRRVGEDHEREIDVRVIAATNRDLQQAVHSQLFREDLYYRLNVVRIRVPPLRERPDDIPLLAKLFVQKFAGEQNKSLEGLSSEALKILTQLPYPGNVRELENYIERAVALASGKEVGASDLPEEVRALSPDETQPLLAFPESGIALETLLESIEKRFIQEALTRSAGVKTKAAELLGLSFRSLRYRLRKLGIATTDEVESDDDPQ